MAEECPQVKCPAGIPAWVLTFADLMSLLVCFFVLLLSFSEMDVQKFKQIAGSMKVAYGVQREIKAVEIPKGTNIIAKEFSPAPPQPTVINEVRQKTSQDTNQELMLVKRIDELEALENDLSKKLGKSESDEESEQIQEKIKKVEEEIIQLKAELEKIKNKIGDIQAQEIAEQAMQVAESLSEEIKQGILEIETNQDSFLIRIKDKGAFPAGSARLTDDFIDVLDVIKKELSNIKGGIIVAGHTDNIPISTRAFRSNWELSAARSVSVVQELIYQSKIDSQRISIQAFAESRPLVDNKTPENRSKNRRVEIVISKSKKDELDSLDKSGNVKDKLNKTDADAKTKQTKKVTGEKGKAGKNRRPEPDVRVENKPEDVNDVFIPDTGKNERQNFINF